MAKEAFRNWCKNAAEICVSAPVDDAGGAVEPREDGDGVRERADMGSGGGRDELLGARRRMQGKMGESLCQRGFGTE
jgi:hypothetical protein